MLWLHTSLLDFLLSHYSCFHSSFSPKHFQRAAIASPSSHMAWNMVMGPEQCLCTVFYVCEGG
ncbi:hypothetical protein DL89DRAFT_268654 [Linderina pennispora]|uniref:Uncharacterized protein n=1 Tax=Linderina pennispora TaxID=61395 RepID=A0A1Y1W467_9FUNG|nr:uncharacterized protein DL89DRAFT_268654 [Linderina pennispora]ORX68115.1 hypothetical protein DL89DRAFT_268654 [Linderina pennispora]